MCGIFDRVEKIDCEAGFLLSFYFEYEVFSVE